MARVFFYVQHLLGIGHVFRALRIAHGLRAEGFDVDLVMGGVPVPDLDTMGFNVIQLQPPLKAGPAGFSELMTENGAPADDAVKAQRTAELLAAFTASNPDVVLVEAYPFGRRQVRFELIPLLELAHSRPRRPSIVSSIRDILQEKAKPGRLRETVDVLQRYFDCVIVHGDASFVELLATFPLAHEIAPLLSYSGLVTPQRPKPMHLADVIISAGGGAVGTKMIQIAIAAKASTSLASLRWLALAGPNANAADFERLEKLGQQAGVRVERFVPNLTAALAGARLSISQTGYNTVADVLVAGCHAVFVPFARDGETEQSRRAALLQDRGFGVVIAEERMTPAGLSQAIDRALVLPRNKSNLSLEGAARTARILRDLL